MRRFVRSDKGLVMKKMKKGESTLGPTWPNGVSTMAWKPHGRSPSRLFTHLPGMSLHKDARPVLKPTTAAPRPRLAKPHIPSIMIMIATS